MAVNFYSPPFFALNNFSAHAIEYEGKLYPTSEHAYQAAKLSDESAREEVRAARSPLETKRLANEVYAHFRIERDEAAKLALMEDILRAKLAQHTEVQDILKQTGTEEIVEDSPIDYFWGEGKDGTGRNELGKLWMKIRGEINADRK